MTKYLVQRRATLAAGWAPIPGDVVVDPPGADILVRRGFLTPVANDYPGAVSYPRTVTTVAAPEPTVAAIEESIATDLKSLSYTDLRGRAKLLGVSGRQSRAKMEKEIRKAEAAVPTSKGAPKTPRGTLEAMPDDELVAAAHEYKVEVTGREQTIAAILEKAGHKPEAQE